MSGDREVQLLTLTSTFTENAKTFEVSLYDVIDTGREVVPQSADWTYNEDYEHEYDDMYLTWNLAEELDIVDGTESWYGVHNYFTQSII
jgi:broad specificity phosphatase PhoE